MRIRRESGGLVRLKPGSVYPALRGLERDGLVARRRAGGTGRRGRPCVRYELTLAGVRAAMAQRRALRGLVGSSAPQPAAAHGVRERLERASALSASVLELRRRVRQKAG